MNYAESIYEFSGKLSHRSRCLYQWVKRPEIGIIGSYHGGNLGDLCLGKSVAEILRKRKTHHQLGLQTVYNLSKWPSTKKGILGGGAVAYEETLANLSSRYEKHPQNLVFLGVDFNDLKVVESYRDFLKDVFAITCRSKVQADEVAACLGRKDILAHPDLTFAIIPEDRKSEGIPSFQKNGEQPTCGLNIPPLMFSKAKDGWGLGSHFSEEILRSAPSANADMKRLGQAYIEFFQATAKSLLAQGYRLEHIPFEGNDDLFARHILKGLPIHFYPYRRSTETVVSRMKCQQLFLSGRFHSLVFSLRERVPCLAFCYSSKSERLMDDLQVDRALVLHLDDIVNGLTDERMAAFTSSPVVFDSKTVEAIGNDVQTTISTLFDKWGV